MSEEQSLTSADDDAVHDYLALLREKGANTASINKRKHFLRHLTDWLKNKPHTGDFYRAGVDAVLERFDEEETRYFFLVVAREFYYFWIGDMRSVAMTMVSGVFENEPIRIEINETLLDLFARIDTVAWSEAEESCIAGYVSCLEHLDYPMASVDIRERILRVVLLKLRGLPVNGATFRAVVDAMMPLFKKAEGRYMFLAVTREFYYFWMGDTNAPSRVSATEVSMSGGKPVL